MVGLLRSFCTSFNCTIFYLFQSLFLEKAYSILLSNNRNVMDITTKGVTYCSSTNKIKTCLFCRILNKQESANIVYEDMKYVVFETINPATSKHLLVSPREHIQNLKFLRGSEDAGLVREMMEVGKIALGGDGGGAQFCFHVPPFNSIDHLHMHAIGKVLGRVV